jgi:hypothetical protein
MTIDHGATDQHVAFAGHLTRWLERAGMDSDAASEMAVGFADILNAASRAAPELEALLSTDPRTHGGADAALGRLGYLNALFLTEIKDHLEDLVNHWESLESRLLATAPDAED